MPRGPFIEISLEAVIDNRESQLWSNFFFLSYVPVCSKIAAQSDYIQVTFSAFINK